MKTKKELPECPVATSVSLIGGKWKLDDGLVYRNDYHENPPRVDYGLTDLGKEMMPIIDALADFGIYYKTVVD